MGANLSELVDQIKLLLEHLIAIMCIIPLSIEIAVSVSEDKAVTRAGHAYLDFNSGNNAEELDFLFLN